MNQTIRFAGLVLVIAALVLTLAACGGQRNTQPVDTPSVPPSEIVVETPPPSPTPSATPTPSVPAVPSPSPVAVTTVPMPMPSVSPTVAVTNVPEGATPAVTSTVSPSPSASPSPTPTPYSQDANFASTINPDGYFVPDDAVPGYLNANGVVFRGGPSTSARVLGTFDAGTYVDILGVENGWVEVVIGGITGYVRSDYVTRGEYGGQGVYYGDPGSSGGVIIVPDVPSTQTQVYPSEDPNPSYFLGIMPD